MKAQVQELRTLVKRLRTIVDLPDLEWRDKYSQVFSNLGAERVYALLNEMNLDFSYLDPNRDYEDDVRAFVDALERRMQEVASLLDVLEESAAPETPAAAQWIASSRYSRHTVILATGDTEEAAVKALREGWDSPVPDATIHTRRFEHGKATFMPLD